MALPLPYSQPSSPLSLRSHESSRMPPPARQGLARPSTKHRPATDLRMPSLPRFHPANFSSQSSSAAITPSSGGTSPVFPTSPLSIQRQYSAAQEQLYTYRRDLLANVGKAAPQRGPPAKPVSPRLAPAAGSPGPMTPLELEAEQRAGYFLAGARGSGTEDGTRQDHVHKLMRDEASRHADISPKRVSVCSY